MDDDESKKVHIYIGNAKGLSTAAITALLTQTDLEYVVIKAEPPPDIETEKIPLTFKDQDLIQEILWERPEKEWWRKGNPRNNRRNKR